MKKVIESYFYSVVKFSKRGSIKDQNSIISIYYTIMMLFLPFKNKIVNFDKIRVGSFQRKSQILEIIQQTQRQQINWQLMQGQQNLQDLQCQLKKEFLMIEREHREKIKLKKQIQDHVDSYFTILIEKKKNGKLLVDDHLGNNYNFVKDLFLALTQDAECGIQILLKADEDIVHELSQLFFCTLYESFTQVDVYRKKMIRFSALLSQKIVDYLNSLEQNKKIGLADLPEIYQSILNEFLKQDDLSEYFNMLGNRVLNQIPLFEGAKLTMRWSVIHMLQEINAPEIMPTNSVSVDSFGESNISSQIQIEKKLQEIIDKFVTDIVSTAELLPLALKVFCYILKKNLKCSHLNRFKIIWQILSQQFMKPFNPDNHSKNWNHFSSPFFRQYLERIKLEASQKLNDQLLITKFIQKCTSINEQKLEQKVHEKIEIHGGCISYRQLYLLFRTIHANYDLVKKYNERIANRIRKISDVSPEFKMFLDFPNPSKSYIIFTTINYGQLIERDYHKIYNDNYRDEMIKNMIKQILSTSDFRIITQIQSGMTLIQILKKSIEEADSRTAADGTVFAQPSQFIMKMKYLEHLMQNKQIVERQIIGQLLVECRKRQEIFIDLIQKTKLYLLEALTSVNKAKRIILSKTQSANNIEKHLKLVKILDKMNLNICISAPSTRPSNFKFTSSQSNCIIIESSVQCCHQENILEGLKCHASSIIEAICIFCDLKQVKQGIATGNDYAGIYEALRKIEQIIKDNFRKNSLLNFEAYHFFQQSIFKILFRLLHEKLVESNQKSLHDIEFEEKVKSLSFVTSQKIKLSKKYNLEELEQIWEIACRYLKNFLHVKKNPVEKIELIKEVTDILKMALQKLSSHQQKISGEILELMLAYTLIRSRLKKFMSHIHFIEIFLPKDMLVKKEGVILERIKNATHLITKEKIKQYLMIEEQDFREKVDDSKTTDYISQFKAKQKKNNSVIYI